MWYAAMAQLVEHILGKDEVPSSNLGISLKTRRLTEKSDALFIFISLFQKYFCKTYFIYAEVVIE